MHGRDGAPTRGVLVCDLPAGTRTYAVLTDPEACLATEQYEFVGAQVRLTADGAVNRAAI